MEHLAFSLGVSIVATVNLTVAREAGLGDLSVDGIVLAWNAGNAGLEHIKGWVAAGATFIGSKTFITGSIRVKGTASRVVV